MHVVTVEFTIDPAQWGAFLPLMLDNARRSREVESACRQFDVCTDDARPGVVYLYERYDDRAAFDTHLASAHYKSFAEATQAMIRNKVVATWHQIAP